MAVAARATAAAARATCIHCTRERPGAARRTRREHARASHHSASPRPRARQWIRTMELASRRWRRRWRRHGPARRRRRGTCVERGEPPAGTEVIGMGGEGAREGPERAKGSA
eukprot:scaffold98334_cov55-Phaeocystis_antarctica.AAC.1